MALLNIQKLSVSVTHEQTQLTLLAQSSCQLEAGEILCIIGPNGAGKSTMLKALSGDVAYTGSIEIAHLANQASLQARQVAVLPQFSLLNFPYHVEEVVALGRIPHQTGKLLDQQIIDQALAAMDISDLKYRLYPELSGGEKQRVQLARVLAQIWRAEDAPAQSRLLILDEPTTALDLGHQRQLMQAIKQFAKQGVAVIMVLHDINLAARYADKLLALLDGKTIAYGDVGEVITPQNIEQLFAIECEIINDPVYGTPFVVSA